MADLGVRMLPPPAAAALAASSRSLEARAAALAGFAEREPELASLAGIEVAALEVRSILAGGAARRVCLSGEDCSRRGAPLAARRDDLDAVSRLEGLVALSDARLRVQMAAMDAAERRGRMEGVGTVIGIATGALGLIRAIF